MAERARIVAALLIVAIGGAGCHKDGAKGHTDLGGPPDLGASPTAVRIAATTGALNVDFTVDVDGAGTSRLGAVKLQGGAGTVAFDGKTLPAFAHERQAWPDQGYTLYQTIAAHETALYVLWLYCTAEDKLVYAYFEGTDGTAMSYEDATGSCLGSTTPSVVTAALPPLALGVALAQGFAATAPRLVVRDGQPGEFGYDTTSTVLLPFEVVDCTACGQVGWYELHSILRDDATHQASFAIFYFWPSKPSDIHVTYSLTLPSLTDPVGTRNLTGSWSYTPPAQRRTPTSPPRLPWLWAPRR